MNGAHALVLVKKGCVSINEARINKMYSAGIPTIQRPVLSP